MTMAKRKATLLKNIHFAEVSIVDRPASEGSDILFSKSLTRGFVPLLGYVDGELIEKFNANHDPATGQFASGGSTAVATSPAGRRGLFSNTGARSLATHGAAAAAGAVAGALAS